MMKNVKFDLIIIGGGAPALSAAIKANMRGVKAAIMENMTKIVFRYAKPRTPEDVLRP